jgi:hypothetical protein
MKRGACFERALNALFDGKCRYGLGCHKMATCGGCPRIDDEKVIAALDKPWKGNNDPLPADDPGNASDSDATMDSTEEAAHEARKAKRAKLSSSTDIIDLTN